MQEKEDFEDIKKEYLQFLGKTKKRVGGTFRKN